MNKTTVTYIYKLKDADLFVTNKPIRDNDVIRYSSSRADAREFNGTELVTLDWNLYQVIKKTVTEITEWEYMEENENANETETEQSNTIPSKAHKGNGIQWL